jgi:ribosomal protein S27E
MRFKTCPKCQAQAEDVPGVACWNCGHVDGVGQGGNAKKQEYPDSIDPSDFNDPYLVQGIAFKACGNCGAHCDAPATQCWDCGTKFKTTIPASIAHGNEGSAIAERKNVPFGELTATPPGEKKKASPIGAEAKALENMGIDPAGKKAEAEKAEERAMKKERRLILFHCPRCNGFFKVVFRKVRDKVKCPECKTMLMKIPYFCTRCKRTEDFETIAAHVCKPCNLEMILDPNYE